jgi:hypothetical protein
LTFLQICSRNKNTHLNNKVKASKIKRKRRRKQFNSSSNSINSIVYILIREFQPKQKIQTPPTRDKSRDSGDANLISHVKKKKILNE